MKVWIWTALIAAVVVGGLAFMAHYNNLVEERDQYMVERQLSEAAHQQTKASFNAYRAAADARAAHLERALAKLNAQFKKSQETADETTDTLARHDLRDLAQKKPGLVGRVINDGTDRVFQHIETATGAGDRNPYD